MTLSEKSAYLKLSLIHISFSVMPGWMTFSRSSNVRSVISCAFFIYSISHGSLLARGALISAAPIFENKDEIAATHAKGEELDLDYAVSGISVPFHPGAEKYFKEVGAIK